MTHLYYTMLVLDFHPGTFWDKAVVFAVPG